MYRLDVAQLKSLADDNTMHVSTTTNTFKSFLKLYIHAYDIKSSLIL